MATKHPPIRNLIAVSDLHCGCQLGLCPPVVYLDDGGTYRPGVLQSQVWDYWLDFWGVWVPKVTRGEPYAVLVNGDTLEGVHHRAKTPITTNHEIQRRIAYEVLAPVRDGAERFYMVRGTEAHVGQSAENEEALARALDAVPNEFGQSCRYDLWCQVGDGLVHALHHIGTTGSMAYETTALTKEYNEACSAAARWEMPPPHVVVRSHRHRHSEVRVPCAWGYGIVFVTPSWQLKTPFTWKVPGGRLTEPQFGGSLIRWGDEDGLYTRHKVWTMKRSKTARPKATIEGAT